MSDPKKSPPPPPAAPDSPQHEEWRIDEAEDESFPTSDPNTETQPKPTRGQK
jgi:hypothetical protein